MSQTIFSIITRLIKEEIKGLGLTEDDLPQGLTVESPKNLSFGDISTNISFLLAKRLKSSPFKIATDLAALITPDNELLEKVEVAGGGFLNFFLAKKKLQEIVVEIEEKGALFGSSKMGAGQKVLVEFVSANPTGPLHIGHGRGAVLGDTLANIFSFLGYQVAREYYVNDTGRQIKTLGDSLRARYLEVLGEGAAFPEDGYRGRYLLEMAEALAKDNGRALEEKDEKAFGRLAAEEILKEIKATLSSFRVSFDSWPRETDLYGSGRVKEAVGLLEDKGHLYRKDGAVWLRSTKAGDEKDRVLIRENGQPTYLTADIAYHLDKFSRGYDRLIDIWGADHHGYVDRLKAAISFLGRRKEDLTIQLYQLVRLLREGAPVPMSTRAGEFVTLKEVIDEVGTDAARFFLLLCGSGAHLDFDLELAKKTSKENPVYYVQYAHARICSIFNQAKEKEIEPLEGKKCNLDLLGLPAERALMVKLAYFPDEVKISAKTLSPHRLTTYLMELASIFHNYYRFNKVIGEDKELTGSRLCLINAVRIVMGNALSLLGISAPSKM
ncbi:arginine--tRNA ligase [bacterium]|nr:arginine--tRNA ligase [bacterium]